MKRDSRRLMRTALRFWLDLLISERRPSGVCDDFGSSNFIRSSVAQIAQYALGLPNRVHSELIVDAASGIRTRASGSFLFMNGKPLS